MVSIQINEFKNIVSEKKYTFRNNEICHLIGSSGSGKSSIFTAFEWCLYGKITGIKSKSLKKKKKKKSYS